MIATPPSSRRYVPWMRNIPASMDPDVVRAIDARLDRVEQEHDVTVLWAIESGSRNSIASAVRSSVAG
jgi:undecaprenyl pyrophosphate synthase